MNDYQLKLYNDLMELSLTNDAFYHVDQFLDHNYRIFLYRIASYSDFLLDNALESRGIMFRMNPKGFPEQLVSMPMHKFFNYKENPFTETLDGSRVDEVMTKEDGSLISTYIHNNGFNLKSKGSLKSDQAMAAVKWLSECPDKKLIMEIDHLVKQNLTINFEYTAPDNRIVLHYPQPALTILNVRDHITGKYYTRDDFNGYVHLDKLWVQSHDVSEYGTIARFVDAIPDMTHMEGYVLRMGGDFMKIKTDWYVTRHRLKDKIDSDKNLFAVIINEEIDDIFSLFHDDPTVIDRINDMIDMVKPRYNAMIKTIEQYYDEHKDDDRKTYALGALNENKSAMSLYMNLYDHRENDYRSFAIKHYEDFLD